MAHTPHDPERVIEKAFLVRFFADGGFRVEGPFPPLQVQRLIASNECQAWLRDPALVAIWGREPVANISELFTLAPEINEIASRLAHRRYQPLKANHYRAQHARHWRDEKDSQTYGIIGVNEDEGP